MLLRPLTAVTTLLYCALLGATDDCNNSLAHYLACNNPRAIAYLSSLDAHHLGQPLSGFVLSDQTTVLRGHVYLGRVTNAPTGVHVHLFEADKRTFAYAWAEHGATPLALPDCPADNTPGSAHVLSGDVYTWAALQPGEGVVQIDCVDPTWQR